MASSHISSLVRLRLVCLLNAGSRPVRICDQSASQNISIVHVIAKRLAVGEEPITRKLLHGKYQAAYRPYKPESLMRMWQCCGHICSICLSRHKFTSSLPLHIFVVVVTLILKLLCRKIETPEVNWGIQDTEFMDTAYNVGKTIPSFLPSLITRCLGLAS